MKIYNLFYFDVSTYLFACLVIRIVLPKITCAHDKFVVVVSDYIIQYLIHD